MPIFKDFENGSLFLPGKAEIDCGLAPWRPHPKFEGVALKHLITASDTGGAFSYHLVKIAPQKQIGLHLHETQLETHEVIAGQGVCRTGGKALPYKAGNIAVLPAGAKHEVAAGESGLLLFAKFFPALC